MFCSIAAAATSVFFIAVSLNFANTNVQKLLFLSCVLLYYCFSFSSYCAPKCVQTLYFFIEAINVCCLCVECCCLEIRHFCLLLGYTCSKWLCSVLRHRELFLGKVAFYLNQFVLLKLFELLICDGSYRIYLFSWFTVVV